MRRADRQIKDTDVLENLLRQGDLVHLALADNNVPYLVTLNYAYEDGAFYLHCARQGKKIDILRKNPNVFFQIVLLNKLITDEDPCEWTTKFKSLAGEAVAEIQETYEEKRKSLQILMKHYGMVNADFAERETKGVLTIKLTIKSITGKTNEQPVQAE
jgi:nitroimidazol reductase NimA-like FMN-containing flavoprotein (pyridoxamine 5'-phosphate oxidase superfamily)